jgi:hypothetical protein
VSELRHHLSFGILLKTDRIYMSNEALMEFNKAFQLKRMSLTSGVEIKETIFRPDLIGLLGKAVLVKNVMTPILTVSDSTHQYNLNINITNTNKTGDIALVSLWVSSEKEPGLIDAIETDIPLKPTGNFIRMNDLLSPGETLFAMSSEDNVVLRGYGYDLKKE